MAGWTAALLAVAGCSPFQDGGVSADHPVFRPAPMAATMPMAGEPTAPVPVAAGVPAAPMPAQAAVASAVQVQDPAPEPSFAEGWQGLMWGMGRADIRQVMPAATDIKERIGKTERAAFGLDSYELPGCKARALMDFAPAGGLQSVRVVAKGTVDAACVRSVRQGLAEKYGTPAHEEKPKGGLDIHNAVWRLTGVVVSLTSSIDGQGRGLFQIAYANPAGPQATPAQAPPDGKARL